MAAIQSTHLSVEADSIFTVLMGDNIGRRRKFNEDNALDVIWMFRKFRDAPRKPSVTAA